MNRFEVALARRQQHLAAFLMLGDPDPRTSFELALAAAAAGCTMLELGIPFSDPCADGPAIQASCQRARSAGVSTSAALALLARIHAAVPELGLNLLVYGNLVHARGYRDFCHEAYAAGAATLLVPDISFEEAEPLRRACLATELGHVALVGPQTGPKRLAALDASCTSFLYLASHQGVTGLESDDAARQALCQRTSASTTHPVCLGFGISNAAQITAAFDAGAQLVVVGSYLARAIGGARSGDVLRSFSNAVQTLTRALPPTGPSPCS